MEESSLQDSSLPSADFVFLREEIRHEDGLMGQRLSWLVSSQAFLLCGFAIALNGPIAAKSPLYGRLNEMLVHLLPVAGLATCVISCFSVLGGLIHMSHIRKLAAHRHPANFPEVQGSLLTRGLGLTGPTLVPLLFVVVWLILIFKQS